MVAISIDDQFNEYSVARKIGSKKFKLQQCYLEGHSQEDQTTLWELKTCSFFVFRFFLLFIKKRILQRKIIDKKAFYNLVEESVSPLFRSEPKRDSYPVSSNRYFQYFSEHLVLFQPHPISLYVKAVTMLIHLSKGFQAPKNALFLCSEFWKELFVYPHISKAPPLYPNDPGFLKEHPIEQQIRAYDISVMNTLYFTKEAAKLYEVKINMQGVLWTQNAPLETSKLIANTPSDYAPYAIFTLGIDQTLYVARPEVFKLNHSSCLQGGPCLSAGQLKTNSLGQLTEVNSHSGHYKPKKEHLLFFLHFLKQKGVHLKSVKLSPTFGEEFSPLFKSAEKYLEKRGRLKEEGWQFKEIEAFYLFKGEKIEALHFFIELFTSAEDLIVLLKHVLSHLSQKKQRPPTQVIVETLGKFSSEYTTEELLQKGSSFLQKSIIEKMKVFLDLSQKTKNK